jgi:hypothetical protein
MVVLVGAQGQQRPGVPSPHQSYQGQPGAPSPYDTARQLFNSYAPSVLGSLVNRTYGPPPPNPTLLGETVTEAKRFILFDLFREWEHPSLPEDTIHTPRSEGDIPGFPQPRFH